MGNTRIQGKALITIQPPRKTFGEQEPSRVEQVRQWAKAVMSVAFDGEYIRGIERVSIGWGNKSDGNAEIVAHIPCDWDASKIWAVTNEVANKIYQACGTSLSLQKEQDAMHKEENERYYPPRTYVEWIRLDVASSHDRAKAEIVEP